MPIVSIGLDPDAAYPISGEYSPEETYSEYPFSRLSTDNGVYRLVRRCLAGAGVDSQNYDKSGWNPLGRWISKGDRVFVLPNLVTHRSPNEATDDFLAKVTHGSVLRAVIDCIYIATGDLGLISFGNAPLQSCEYESVAVDAGMAHVANFYYEIAGVDVGPQDLRQIVSRWTRYGTLLEREEREEEVVSIDLGKDSFLDKLFRRSDDAVQVRVGDYDPQETMSFHASGRHIYVLNKQVLDADVIVSIPKLKTHQKVGITCALKGTVGTIAKKECLAHHRKGGPKDSGDEYPHDSLLHRAASNLTDIAGKAGNDPLGNGLRILSKSLSRILRLGEQGIMGGAWHGNDTAWRMTLDIARILRYGRPDGTMADTPQRQHIALVDGIVGGEAEGPLRPHAKKTGIILFGTDVCWLDYACALLMGFNPSRIPLIKNAFGGMTYPLTEAQLGDLEVVFNGQYITLDDLKYCLEERFRPPKGWIGHIEG